MAERAHHRIQVITSFLGCLMFVFVITGTSTVWAQAVASTEKTSTQAADVVRNPADVPPPIGNRAPTTIHVMLTAEEVVGQLDPVKRHHLSVLDL